MSDRVLTENLKAEILNEGMDLIGFAPVERWKNAPFLLSPQAILKGAKTVIVTGIHITDAWTQYGGEPSPVYLGPGGWMDQNSLLDRIAFRAVKKLQAYGFEAIAVASSNIWRYRKFDNLPSEFAPDLSHIHASCAAGLSEIGWMGLAITPEFGPRVRFISVVTNADLVESPMYNGPRLCDHCMHCVTCCPSQALKKDFNGKPHEVEIGGKTFMYANKNIWRCAWAEHFNLNLKSETLNQDHIDEATILNEIETKGKVGHERGVCQKVCIPPHLRCDNENEKYALNRINKKYPDTMPTLRKMRDDIISFAIKHGAEIGLAAKIDKDSRAFKGVDKQIKNMETVFGFALRIPEEFKLLDNESDEFAAYSYAIRNKMHHILLKTARYIEDLGYLAGSYTVNDFKIDNLEEVCNNTDYTELVPGGDNPANVLLAYELAQMAGIGKIGEKFISYDFGEDVIVGAIVMNGAVDESPRPESISKPAEFKPRIKNLKSYLENVAHNNLVDLFGVADASVFDKILMDIKENVDENSIKKHVIDLGTPAHGKWVSKIVENGHKFSHPRDYVKNAKSVIVLGMNISNELMENVGNSDTKQIGTYGYYSYQTVYELRFAALEIATALNRLGYASLITDDMLKIGSRMDSPRGALPDFRCCAVEAVAAGLGEIGKNGALLTPEYGANQKLIAIVTDAPLSADTVYNDKKLCTECNNCICKCTTNALVDKYFDIHIGNTITKYPVIDRFRCDWAKRYSLSKTEGPELIGNETDVKLPKGKVTIEVLADACEQKDEVMKHRTVILEPCLKNCRSGKA